MCGIFGIFGAKGDVLHWRQLAVKLSRRQRHRGPDATGVVVIQDADGTINILVHERLMINEVSSYGNQPITHPDNENLIYCVNGEIYNFEDLKKKFPTTQPLQGHSDSQALGITYNKLGLGAFETLEGMWGTIIYDKSKKEFTAARDHVGIIPIYVGSNKDGVIFISSEMKAIHDVSDASLKVLLPGHYIQGNLEQKRWYNPSWYNMDIIPTTPVDLVELRNRLIATVKEDLMTDVPYGLLISGGLDSSLIAAITMRLVREGQGHLKELDMHDVHSFCIGLEGSPDLAASRKVAEFIGTKHHELVFTVEEGLDAISEVIYHVESYNPTTIRASTPMYLMARRIKAMGIKMVLTGEGADEIFGGYLYFHKAPSKEELHKETVRKVQDLYKFDLLRANKACMAWGLEVRPPLLNRDFMEYSMSFDPAAKWVKSTAKPIEKWALRAAFDDPEKPYIPSEILWRQKEQFSDGVGYKWLDGVKAYAEKLVSTADWDNRTNIFPVNTPTSKEMFLFRRIYEQHFPSKDAVLTVPFNLSIACSTAAALEWDESFKKNTDESGRAVLGIHDKAEKLQDTHSHEQHSRVVKS